MLTPASNPPETLVQVCYRVDKRQIGYLRFTLEGYDGLGFIRTLDAGGGLIEIAWPASRDRDMRDLLVNLTAEVGLRQEPRPMDYPPL